ncbi:dihydrofolate reductase family protein [Streptosporangiaceae bacterium NEAU-GS5]|nr:dihydrofolate reductase family protein [Streptosporangiaceae bacterium NEAU-GS5]
MTNILMVDVFLSMDGWAGSDGLPGYFGYLGPQLEEWIAAEGAAAQVVIMGRRTYEALAGLPEEVRDEGWDRMKQLEKVVFSRTLTHVSWPNTRICSGDLVGEIRAMKADSDVPLRTMGSISLARQLLGAGLVDRLRLMIFPLLAGPDGREAAFQGVDSADLELIDHRVLDGRVLLVEYRPTGRDIPRA